jgi:hypothetical protein
MAVTWSTLSKEDRTTEAKANGYCDRDHPRRESDKRGPGDYDVEGALTETPVEGDTNSSRIDR